MMASHFKPRSPWHLITIFIVMVIGIGTSGYLYYKNQKEQITKAKEEELSAIADLQVGEISRWRKNRIEDGMLIFRNPLIVSRFHRWMGKQRDYKLQQEIVTWMKLLQEHHSYYDSVILLDTNAEPLLSVPNVETVGTNGRKIAAEAMQKKEVMLSDIYRSSTNQIRMAVLIPLLISNGHDTLTAGVLLLRIDPQRFFYPLIQSWPAPSRTAESLLVRVEGNDILFLNELRHRKNTALSLRLPLTQQHLPAAIAAQGKERIIEGTDYRGVQVLAALRAIHGSPWFLIAKVDTEELYAELREKARLIVVVVSMLIVFSGILIVFFWQQQRKKAEGAIEKLRYQNELILKSAGEGIFGLDLEGKHIFINASGARMLGYEIEELLGQPSHAVCHHSKADGSPYPEEECPIYAAYKDGTIHRMKEDVFWRKDGKIFPVAYTSTPVMENDKIVGAVVTFRDITERKRAEEELKKYHERLEELVKQRTGELEKTTDELTRSNAELQQFAYVASHDLQEPLRTIAGFVKLLEKRYKGKLDEQADEFITYTVDGVKRMQQLIQNLLEYSKVGTKDLNCKPTDCSLVVDESISNLQVAIQEKGALVAHDELPTLMVDASQMTRLFQNLIGNAIKFHGKEPPAIHVSAQRKESEWVFSVKDNGIGIDPQNAGKIFFIFQRLHSAEDYPGTGIGLAICKKIVERHGGRIWVESEQRKGSTFYFTIPNREAAV